MSESDWLSQQVQLETLREELPRLMWQAVGICREQKGLETAIAQVEIWREDFTSLPFSQFLLNLHPLESTSFNSPNTNQQLRLWAETRNLLDVGYLILNSAAFRTESRGGHYRLDYPHSDPSWQVHTLVQQNKWWKSQLLQE